MRVDGRLTTEKLSQILPVILLHSSLWKRLRWRWWFTGNPRPF